MYTQRSLNSTRSHIYNKKKVIKKLKKKSNKKTFFFSSHKRSLTLSTDKTVEKHIYIGQQHSSLVQVLVLWQLLLVLLQRNDSLTHGSRLEQARHSRDLGSLILSCQSAVLLLLLLLSAIFRHVKVIENALFNL